MEVRLKDLLNNKLKLLVKLIEINNESIILK